MYCKRFYKLIGSMLLCAAAAAQSGMRLHLKIIEGDTRKITPAMVCITNLQTGTVHLPPHGATAPAPTFTDPFFTGIAFTKSKGWVGPVRKMNGKGEVNGQRTYVYNPNASLPYWPEPVQYQTSGDFIIQLTPGRWRISVQHGAEYIPASDTINIKPRQQNFQKAIVLQRWIDLPQRGWWSGDVHTHHPLNEKRFQQYMLQLARAEDVHLLNVLEMGDRQHLYFKPEGYGNAHQKHNGTYSLATGQEEPRYSYGHIIGLNIDTLARDTAQYNHYDVVLKKLHRSPGALAGFAHFAYGGEGVAEGLPLYAPSGLIDFVELLQNTKIDTARYYAFLNLGFHLAAAAGSDFPWGSTVGDGRTFVYTGKTFSADAWFAGLKAGRSFVSNGPALLLQGDGQLPGTHITKQKGDSILITVQTFSNAHIGVIDKIQIRNNDGVLYESGNEKGLDSITIKLSHRITKSQWIAASVWCTNGALAHTSPLYIVVNEQPTYSMEKGPAIAQNLIAVLEEAKQKEAAQQPVDSGLIQRIETAQAWYRNLMKAMQQPHSKAEIKQ